MYHVKRFFGHFISIVFQPLLLPFYGTLYVFNSNPFAYPDAFENRMMIIRVALLTFLFPALAVALMVGLKFIKNIQVRDRHDRVLPYIAAMLFYIWAFFVFYKEGFNGAITFILLAATISIILAFLINILYLKVSMHTTGGGGLIAMVMIFIPYSHYNPLYAFLAAILIAGAIGSARLALNAHTTREVYYGYLTGFFSFMIANVFFHF